MAVRRPLFLAVDAVVANNGSTLYQYTDPYMSDMITFASYVHAQLPAIKLEVGTASGTQMPNQNFTDTYYIAGASTTRVDRYATAAETPNISMVTDTYNRIRVVPYTGGFPGGDTNKFRFPLFLKL